MDTLNNSAINFTARIRLAKGIGNRTFNKACKEFEKSTANDNTVLHMWEDGGVYKFDTKVKNELSASTQYVGKDVLGYLMMESSINNIADFLKTTLKAVKIRQQHNTGSEFINNMRANIDATLVYLKDKAIGHKIKTNFENGFVDYDKAGSCIHIE